MRLEHSRFSSNHSHWVAFTFINGLVLPPMHDTWWNANSAVNMDGIVLSAPSCSRMLSLMEAFQASDFNLHAYPLCLLGVQLWILHWYSTRILDIMHSLGSTLEMPKKFYYIWRSWHTRWLHHISMNAHARGVYATYISIDNVDLTSKQKS